MVMCIGGELVKGLRSAVASWIAAATASGVLTGPDVP